ncbi:hypothetical protein JXJ21_11855 [candidate division KSB1 bacterium]|nr:hypothetical protein [candidate division KSB1 bacterium]
MAVTLDTHVFVWYLDRDLNAKLTTPALNSIKEAESTDIDYIPIIVMVELLYLLWVYYWVVCISPANIPTRMKILRDKAQCKIIIMQNQK